MLAQDYDAATPWKAILLRIEPGPGGYVVTEALTDLPMLDRVMGLAVDGAGNRFYATSIDEDDVVDSDYPAPGVYRNDIVRVIKLNAAGEVLFNVDLDVARHNVNQNAEAIINPMIAASARLAVGGNEAGPFSDVYDGVYGMVVDDQGNTLQPATLLTVEHHLHRSRPAVAPRRDHCPGCRPLPPARGVASKG